MQTLAQLDPDSLRVLGSLMEKEMTTPDLYPLSLNALEAAANQRSSRDPVMTLAAHQVQSALSTLEQRGLVAVAHGSRVLRYEHRIRTVLTLRRDETAIVCLLLLRGPQTVGELRSRSDRMFLFEDLESVQGALDRMAAREVPLVRALPRAPGSREVRWVHLLGNAAPQPAHAETRAPDASLAEPASPVEVWSELRTLRDRVAALEARLERLES